MSKNTAKKGFALVIAMIFLVIFTAMAAAISRLANDNVTMSDNQVRSGRALANAESGLQIMRYWASGMSVPGTVAPANRLSSVISSMQSKIEAQNATCMKLELSGAQGILSSIALDDSGKERFSAVFTQPDVNTLQLDVTGHSGEASKTIRVSWNFVKRGNSVFDFGIATRAPLWIKGNIDLIGVNVAVEASVYIESLNQLCALNLIGNSHIAGDVSIVNEYGYAALQGASTIAGARGAAAEEHVHTNVPPADFPVPVTETFRSYCTTVIDKDHMGNGTYVNARIAANTNPKFTGATFQGVLFIETPNQVTFTGNTTVTGIIVGNGDVDDTSNANWVDFQGTVDSHAITT